MLVATITLNIVYVSWLSVLRIAFLFNFLKTHMKKTPELFDIENEARKGIEFHRNWKPLPIVWVWDIRWYYVWLNIWQEISKWFPYQRPCIAIGKIKNTSLIRIVPLTTKRYPKHKDNLIELEWVKKYDMKQSRLATHHICTIDKKRLIKKQTYERVSKNFCKNLLKKIR